MRISEAAHAFLRRVFSKSAFISSPVFPSERSHPQQAVYFEGSDVNFLLQEEVARVQASLTELQEIQYLLLTPSFVQNLPVSLPSQTKLSHPDLQALAEQLELRALIIQEQLNLKSPP